MNTILRKFVNEPLFDACAAMLNHLHIEFNEVTRTPVPFEGLYRNPLTKALQEIMSKVDNTYFIGTVDEASLSGHSVHQDENDVTTKASEGKYIGMMIFAVDIKGSLTLTRTEMATLTRGFNRIAAAQPVVLFIKQGDHLALATCERSEYTQQWRDGEKLGKVSMLRNINCQNPHRGHIDILESIGDKAYPTFEELYKHWMQVFSSELLTKKFYNDLFEWYQWAVSPEAKVTFPGDVDTQEDDREDIDTRIIRLITRLMFVWFIKQKGLVPSNIFDKKYVTTILKDFDAQSTTEGNYYQAILQNLFFGTLNRPIMEDGEQREFAQANTADVKNLYRYAELFSISEDEVIDLFSTVPFLNCGLFECQDKTKTLDGVERRFYYDGFSRNGRKKNGVFLYRAFVPNVLFFHPIKGIISIFNKYVFTIEENTPQDVQVALDPELLGKVFENLLGAYNPETKETARNESGSFYTPREIVQYMVNESLVAHLKQTVGAELEPQYRQLLDFTTEDVQLTAEQKAQILQSLFNCKILDPACGSGAFPMGMLQQMVHILQQVDPDNTQWRDILLNMAVDESRRAFGIVDEDERKKKLLEIEETFNNGLNSPDYTRKLYIIESCIYGVDIQPIAMLISRLRFFITLICEQNDIQRDKPEINFGIKTLPNLESKFVAANSLINADIHQYNEDWTNDEVLALLKNELIAIRRRHFYTRKRSEKIRLLKEDEAKRKQIHEHINRLVGEPNEAKIVSLQQQIADNEKLLEMYQGEDWIEEAVQKDLFSEPQIVRVDRNKRERNRINGIISACRRDIEHEQNKCTPQGFEAAVLQVTDWNPYDQNSVSPFLDVEWMFGVTDGFDIVISNPPYLRIQGIRRANNAFADFLSNNYKAATGSFDLYMCFVEKSLDLISTNGLVNFIMPVKWTNSAAGKGLRKLTSEGHLVSKIINFGAYQVFNASTYTGLQWFKPNSYLLDYNELDHDLPTNQELKAYLDTLTLDDFAQIRHEGLTEEPWVLTSSKIGKILDKLYQQPKRLQDYFDKIFCGLQTSRDNTYFLQHCSYTDNYVSGYSKDLNKVVTIEVGLTHPLLKGDDVHRYDVIQTHRAVIFPYHIEKEGAILYTEKELKDLFPKGYEYLHECEDILKSRENGRLRHDPCWYKYIYPKSLALFCKEKLVSPYTSLGSNYAYDAKGEFYATTKIYGYIKKNGVKSSYKALLAILNSSVMWYFIKNTGYVLRGGYYTYATNYVNPFPLPSDETILAVESRLESLVDEITKAKIDHQEDKVKYFESEIEEIVYNLYGLTQEERDAIGYIDFHNNNDNEPDDDE
ncbi:MAG: Eco57I restriction-modification methylase domain-containing protein [Prevotella sp.]|nr:Eco57I restriction-modification methylase domain-containing protein [Prevotella sp.]